MTTTVKGLQRLDRTADHRRREDQRRRAAPNICASWRSTPASSRRRSSRRAASRASSPRSTPARRSRSASTSCTTSSSSTRPNGARRRSRGGWSTGRAKARRSWAAAPSTRRARKWRSCRRCTPSRRRGRKLPVNLVLVAEGEEEIASPNFPTVVANPEVAAALKKTVGVFIPTSSQDAKGNAGITLGAKGAVEFQLIVGGETSRQISQDRHSFEQPCARRKPGMAAGQGARHVGRRRRPHAGDRRLVRACPAADRPPEGADRRARPGQQRSRGQEEPGRRPLDQQ